MKADRRDNNEKEIVQFWQALGYAWIAAKPGQGFDGLLVTPLDIYVIEIKNPRRNWKFTECEQRTKDMIEALGQEYHVVEDMHDAEYLAGVIGGA